MKKIFFLKKSIPLLLQNDNFPAKIENWQTLQFTKAYLESSQVCIENYEIS